VYSLDKLTILGGIKMKRASVLCLVVLVSVVLAFLFISSCNSAPKCSVATSPEYYHISFILDGPAIDARDVILNFGGDYDTPNLTLDPSNNWMEMRGFYCACGDEALFPTFRLWARPRFFNPGVYEGVYGGSGPSIGIIESTLTITEEDIEYDYSATSALSS